MARIHPGACAVPDPEHPDPEIVDFAPNPARTRLLIAIAAVAAAGMSDAAPRA
jgi:hypothetical protein